MTDFLRKKMLLPRKPDHTNGQDANGCFERMCRHAGLEPNRDFDHQPVGDVDETLTMDNCNDADLGRAFEAGKLKEMHCGWYYTTG